MDRRIVIGDVHGCFNTLRIMVEEQIIATRNDSLYFVGDLIDRGPGSREVLDYLMQLKSQHYHVYCVRGNHEDMFLNALNDKNMLQNWIRNGASETLRSFEIPDISVFTGDFLHLIPDPYIDFLKGFPYYYDLEDYIIVHAGLNFDSPDIFGDEHAMLWSRKMDYSGEKINYKTIVHGHTPIPAESIKQLVSDHSNKVLNIDAGCVYKDYPGYAMLSALDLGSRYLFLQKNKD